MRGQRAVPLRRVRSVVLHGLLKKVLDAQGQRYGADGDGYSIYLTDPEGTVVELKSGN